MKYQKILDALPELIYITEPDGLTGVFFNKAWYEYTGFTEDSALEGWRHIVEPYDRPRVEHIIRKATLNKEPYEVEVRLLCQDTGEYKWFLSKGKPVFEGDELKYYVGMSTDINNIKLSVLDMAAVYERETEKRLEKIKELEKELAIHRTNS